MTLSNGDKAPHKTRVSEIDEYLMMYMFKSIVGAFLINALRVAVESRNLSFCQYNPFNSVCINVQLFLAYPPRNSINSLISSVQ